MSRLARGRVERAKALRDFVLPLIREEGTLERVGPAAVVLWRTHSWSFLYRTPFSRLPSSEAPALSYLHALLLQHVRPLLPYGLDVWHGPKVMSVEWNDIEFHLISFRSGPWEAELMNLNTAPPSSTPVGQRR